MKFDNKVVVFLLSNLKIKLHHLFFLWRWMMPMIKKHDNITQLKLILFTNYGVSVDNHIYFQLLFSNIQRGFVRNLLNNYDTTWTCKVNCVDLSYVGCTD